MEIKKILIYGSSHLTKETCNLLENHYELVGHIPSKNPVIGSEMTLPIVDESVDHDIKLSLQYNRRLLNLENAFNVHTGLLPEWGGTDILYHTLKENSKEQGLTFHKMTEIFDKGPIISKMTYPVFKEDTMVELYGRLIQIAPVFVLGSLKLLESITTVDECYSETPQMYKRANIDETDLEVYNNTIPNIKKIYNI
jgi:methionyl-tRNA formyltransferase